MKKQPKSSFNKVLSAALRKFHMTIFIVFVITCLASGVLLINQMISEGDTAASNYTSSISAGTIDQATLGRLQALHTSTEADTEYTPPAGRINPFSE